MTRFNENHVTTWRSVNSKVWYQLCETIWIRGSRFWYQIDSKFGYRTCVTFSDYNTKVIYVSKFGTWFEQKMKQIWFQKLKPRLGKNMFFCINNNSNTLFKMCEQRWMCGIRFLHHKCLKIGSNICGACYNYNMSVRSRPNFGIDVVPRLWTCFCSKTGTTLRTNACNCCKQCAADLA